MLISSRQTHSQGRQTTWLTGRFHLRYLKPGSCRPEDPFVACLDVQEAREVKLVQEDRFFSISLPLSCANKARRPDHGLSRDVSGCQLHIRHHKLLTILVLQISIISIFKLWSDECSCHKCCASASEVGCLTMSELTPQQDTSGFSNFSFQTLKSVGEGMFSPSQVAVSCRLADGTCSSISSAIRG